jgi:hypothetical protein
VSERAKELSSPSRRSRDFALALCVVWLLVQNSLLVAWLTHQHLGPYFTVARALVKVGLTLAGQLWMLPAAALLGVALALSTGAREDRARKDREVPHAV